MSAAPFGFGPPSGPYSGLRRSVIDDVTGRPVVTSPPTGEIATRSTFFPVGVDDGGSLRFPVWPGFVTGAVEAAKFPGQVYRGEAGVYDPTTGHVSEEAIGKAADIAGLAFTGSLPFSKPAGAIGMFGGRNAKTADLPALKLAEILDTKFGASREKIWEDTGWFKGADQQWRFEIPDDLATLGPAKNAPAGYSRLHHDDLAEAYPGLWQGAQQSIREGAVAKGRYEAQDGVIHAQGPTEAAQRSVALHEYQHPIQRSEGFAVGDNPQNHGAAAWEAAGRPMLSESPDAASAHAAWARDQYHRSAGEVEARNVQRRADMTPDQRFSTPPWLTQDVPDAQQIVRFGHESPATMASAPIRAYHGSPHAFDRFDISKIGTGEGAQVYGHGLYFAEKEAVAKTYRDTISPMTFKADGLPITDDAGRMFAESQSRNGTNLDEVVASLRNDLKGHAADDPGTQMMRDYLRRAEEIRAAKIEAVPTGHMYEVAIDANPAKMLDWDAPLARQSADVRRFADRAGASSATAKGEDLIADLARRGYDPAETSADLRRAGIPGVRYLDKGSRDALEGTRNYVTFSDDIVSILRKYEVAGAAGAGAAAGSLAAPNNAEAAPSQGTSPVSASPFGFGAPMAPEDLARLFGRAPLGPPQGFAPIAENEADVQRLERATGMVPQTAAPAPRAGLVDFAPASRSSAMTVPLPPARPAEFSTAEADLPALGAQPIMAAPSPAASTPAAPEGPSLGDRFLKGLRDNGDYFGALGAGLLSSPTWAGGISAGIQLASKSEKDRAVTDLAKAEHGLKQRKLAQETSTLKGNAAILKKAYPNLSDEEASAQGSNSAAVTEALKILRNPSHGREKDDVQLITRPDGSIVAVNKSQIGETSGAPAVTPVVPGTSKLAAEADERRNLVVSQGKDPNDPRYADFIVSGTLPKETQQLLTASDKKAVMEGEDSILAHTNTITQLNRALKLSKKAYDGAGASQRAFVTSNLPGFLGGGSEESLATRELDNVVISQALDSLKSIFGGAPTEGERAILLQIQGSANLPQALREQIYNNAIAKVQQKLAFEQQRVDQLRGGTYYKQGNGAVPAPQTPTGASTGRLRFNPATGAFN